MVYMGTTTLACLLLIVVQAHGMSFGLDGFAMSRHLNRMYGKKSEIPVRPPHPPPARKQLDLNMLMRQPVMINLNPSLELEEPFEVIEDDIPNMSRPSPYRLKARTRLWLIRK
uniref:Uncharacterized protein n=1 Tax=Steinernema glaseri TaxID=37863 RepID=A0A1I7Y8Z3_9BILA